MSITFEVDYNVLGLSGKYSLATSSKYSSVSKSGIEKGLFEAASEPSVIKVFVLASIASK